MSDRLGNEEDWAHADAPAEGGGLPGLPLGCRTERLLEERAVRHDGHPLLPLQRRLASRLDGLADASRAVPLLLLERLGLPGHLGLHALVRQAEPLHPGERRAHDFVVIVVFLNVIGSCPG